VLLELRHLKQPAEEIGPWTIVVDHATGALAVHDATNVAALLGLNPGGLTAKAAASTLFATESPRESQIEKARRKLEALVTEGVARRIDPDAPTEAVRYVERIEAQARS
jgi:replicative DNA helicase